MSGCDQNRRWRIRNEGNFRVEDSTYSYKYSVSDSEMNIPPQTAFPFKLRSCRLRR